MEFESGDVVRCRSCNRDFEVLEVMPESLVEISNGTRYLHPKSDCDKE